jgi:hypothetical protein
LGQVHANLRRTLCERFGGFTAQSVFGGWLAPNGTLDEEPGTAYDVAVPEGDASCEGFLRTLARNVGAQAAQQAMYLRHASGEVEIIDTADARPQAA